MQETKTSDISDINLVDVSWGSQVSICEWTQMKFGREGSLFLMQSYRIVPVSIFIVWKVAAGNCQMNKWTNESKDVKYQKQKNKKQQHQRSSKALLQNSSPYLLRHSNPLNKIEYWFCYPEKLWDFSFVPLHSKRNAEEKN